MARTKSRLGTLYLIKGHGGALLREKIVAAASKRMVVVADETKIVQAAWLAGFRAGRGRAVRMGGDAEASSASLAEIPRCGWAETASPLSPTADTTSWIARLEPMENPKEIAHHLDHVVGVGGARDFLEVCAARFSLAGATA